LLDPKIGILPQSQRAIWNELKATPRHFVLYGGTAIALRLGHRQSEDFDFFSNESFTASELIPKVDYLKHARVDQRGDNTLTVVVDRGGPVRLSYFGSLAMNRVHEPDLATDNGLQIASVLDLAATKLKTIQQRAEAKDYRDVDAVLEDPPTGIFDMRSWAYWHRVYGRSTIPPLPSRRIPEVH
jgi:predicted nucleotidyltransferase component of viral defense system